jgi:hypothetical protein
MQAVTGLRQLRGLRGSGAGPGLGILFGGMLMARQRWRPLFVVLWLGSLLLSRTGSWTERFS